MKKIITIISKEWNIYFKSPIAWVILVLVISLFNGFFYLMIDGNREADLREMFQLMSFLFVFILPLLTMKIFAEEKMNGTMEFLMTTPISNMTIVIGKYLGVLSFYTLIVSLTGSYFFIMDHFTDFDNSSALTGYLGIWMQGALFLAIGCLTSSWTKNQVLAAMTAYVITLSIYFSQLLQPYVGGIGFKVLAHISVFQHVENFSVGLINMSDLVYFCSGIMFCLLLTRLSISKFVGTR